MYPADESFEIGIAIFHSVLECQGEVNMPISPILTLKLVAMATFLEQSGKGGQISNVGSNIYNRVKFW